ncbi:MAG: hypothetical protein KDB79_13330 [Acidobacteria bacterium]|nr:hypothetical protein [Acidobacteriota bacterium]
MASFAKEISDEVKTAIAHELSKIKSTASCWDFIGFDSYGASISIPLIEVGGGLTCGILKVGKVSADQRTITPFLCESLDAGVGISPVPFNVSFPLPTPSGDGVVYKGAGFQNAILEAGSFRGTFMTLTVSAGCGVTAGTTVTFIGAKIIPGTEPLKFIPRIMALSPAVVISAGVSGSLPDAGFTVSVGASI